MSRSETNRTVKKLLGRENYDTWKVYAKSYLVIGGLWKYTQTELSGEAEAGEKENDLKAWSELNLLVDETVLSYIIDTETAKQAWDSLQNAFEDSGLCRKVELLKQLVQLTLSKCASVEDYINRMTMTSSKVNKTGLKLDDELIASLMLAGLPEECKPLVMAIENSTTKLTVDTVKTLLLQDSRLNPQTDVGDALFASQKRPRTHGMTKFRCHRCGEFGHFARECKMEYFQGRGAAAEKVSETYVAQSTRHAEMELDRDRRQDKVVKNYAVRQGEPL